MRIFAPRGVRRRWQRAFAGLLAGLAAASLLATVATPAAADTKNFSASKRETCGFLPTEKNAQPTVSTWGTVKFPNSRRADFTKWTGAAYSYRCGRTDQFISIDGIRAGISFEAKYTRVDTSVTGSWPPGITFSHSTLTANGKQYNSTSGSGSQRSIGVSGAYVEGTKSTDRLGWVKFKVEGRFVKGSATRFVLADTQVYR